MQNPKSGLPVIRFPVMRKVVYLLRLIIPTSTTYTRAIQAAVVYYIKRALARPNIAAVTQILTVYFYFFRIFFLIFLIHIILYY